MLKTNLEDNETEIKLKIPTRRAYRTEELSQDDIDIIKEYLIQDINKTEIAITLGVPPDWLIAKIQELYIKNPTLIEEIKTQKILRMYNEKKSPVQISHKLDIPLAEVKNIINNLIEDGIAIPNVTETKVKRILEEFLTDEKHIQEVRVYIEDLRNKYLETGIFPKAKLDLLDECVTFVQGNLAEIEFLVIAYSLFDEFDKANMAINRNMSNECISREDKEKLEEMSKKILIAIQKENALKMLEKGNISFSQIIEKTGLSETEIIRLSRLTKNNSNKTIVD